MSFEINFMPLVGKQEKRKERVPVGGMKLNSNDI